MRISDWSSDVCSADLDVAAELLDIQAKRQARAGLAIDVDRAMYEPFAATFPFEETPDQHSAIEAVIRDLSSSQPMDRVVCGDVGFGKTEVAVRAAFVAATAGRQVAVLVPTTLLAEQHYRRSEEHTSELQTPMRTSYAVFCWQKKKHKTAADTQQNHI